MTAFWRFFNTLSGRFLLLTLAFVMLAEVLIFVPSMARYRADFLLMRLKEAQIAALSQLAAENSLAPDLEAELLKNAGVYNVVLRRNEVRQLVLSSPIPAPVTATFVQRAATLDEIMKQRDNVLTGVLQPAAIDVIRDGAQWMFALQVGGTERVMERYRRELGGAEKVNEDFWHSVREFSPDWMKANPGGAVVRVSCELRDVGQALGALPGPALARAGNGVVYGAFAEAGAAERWVKATHFRAVIESAPPGSAVERWPKPGGEFAVMEQIKRMLDPKNLLNRGRMYGRL